jgi:O-antigen/teichoic acid export membrane protein
MPYHGLQRTLTCANAMSEAPWQALSRPEGMTKVNERRSFQMGLLLLLPAVVGILVVGDKLLLIFGKDYSQDRP